MPSPNNARPSFVRAVPSAREIQPRPQLRISPGLTHTHLAYIRALNITFFYIAYAGTAAGCFLPGSCYGVARYSRERAPRQRDFAANC